MPSVSVRPRHVCHFDANIPQNKVVPLWISLASAGVDLSRPQYTNPSTGRRVMDTILSSARAQDCGSSPNYAGNFTL